MSKYHFKLSIDAIKKPSCQSVEPINSQAHVLIFFPLEAALGIIVQRVREKKGNEKFKFFKES